MNDKDIAETARRLRVQALARPEHEQDEGRKTLAGDEGESWLIRHGGDVVVLLFSAVFLAGIVWVLSDTVLNVLSYWRSSKWTVADGEVVVSEARPGAKGQYGASVHYRYSVNGNEYVGRRIAFGDYVSGSKERATMIANRYPLGQHVAVHHDPANPVESALVVDSLGEGAWFSLTFLPVMLAAALGLAIYSGKRIFSRNEFPRI